MNKFENFIKNQIVPTLPQVLPSWGKQSDNTGEKVMSKSEHTPGPWVATSDNNTYPGYLIRSDSKPGYIAEIRAFTTQDEVDANKSLIAAAPELYEALCKTRRTIQALIDDGYMGYVDLRSSIDAALAKAEGKA